MNISNQNEGSPSDILFDRDAGVLLHPTSLPGSYGIGDLGPDCLHWVNMLSKAGQSLWQILPISPAGFGESPYQSSSSFAINPLLLSPEDIFEKNLIHHIELAWLRLPALRTIDYPVVRERKAWLASILAERFAALSKTHPLRQQYEEFAAREASWLDDFVLFMALKGKFGGRSWIEWPNDLRQRNPDSLASARSVLAGDIWRESVVQFFLHRQWETVLTTTRNQGIRIVGDLPIFVAHDSADVWCNQRLFQLDETGRPTKVAGVPPDYFSQDGQLWGNPLYDWPQHEAEGFSWWLQRLRKLLDMVDIVRIDHFRGFVACWEIPASASTAIEGSWNSAPGTAFFETAERVFGRPLPFIAEDLGVITPEVIELRDRFGLPGMRIMQFAFGNDPMKHTFVPEAFIPNCAAYTGTHDNDTVVGWFNSQAGEGSSRTAEEITREREAALLYFGGDGSNIHWQFIEHLYRSNAGAAIVPAQDLLGLGSEARMNTPGTASGSWRWRLGGFSQIEDALMHAGKLARQTHRAVRVRTRPSM